MAAVSLLNVEVLKKVAEVTAPLELEITFECLEPLQKGNGLKVRQAMSILHWQPKPICHHKSSELTHIVNGLNFRHRIQTHIRRVVQLVRTRPGPRLVARGTCPRWDIQIRLYSRSSGRLAYPGLRTLRRNCHLIDGQLRWEGVRAGGVLCQQRVYR